MAGFGLFAWALPGFDVFVIGSPAMPMFRPTGLRTRRLTERCLACCSKVACLRPNVMHTVCTPVPFTRKAANGTALKLELRLDSSLGQTTDTNYLTRTAAEIIHNNSGRDRELNEVGRIPGSPSECPRSPVCPPEWPRVLVGKLGVPSAAACREPPPAICPGEVAALAHPPARSTCWLPSPPAPPDCRTCPSSARCHPLTAAPPDPQPASQLGSSGSPSRCPPHRGCRPCAAPVCPGGPPPELH